MEMWTILFTNFQSHWRTNQYLKWSYLSSGRYYDRIVYSAVLNDHISGDSNMVGTTTLNLCHSYSRCERCQYRSYSYHYENQLHRCAHYNRIRMVNYCTSQKSLTSPQLYMLWQSYLHQCVHLVVVIIRKILACWLEHVCESPNCDTKTLYFCQNHVILEIYDNWLCEFSRL